MRIADFLDHLQEHHSSLEFLRRNFSGENKEMFIDSLLIINKDSNVQGVKGTGGHWEYCGPHSKYYNNTRI